MMQRKPMCALRLVALLCLATLAAPGHAAEKCLAQSIDKIGSCKAYRNSGVQATLDRELRGSMPQRVAPPFDATLAATRISGAMAVGTARPIAPRPAGKKPAKVRYQDSSMWVLVLQPAAPDAQGQLQPMHQQAPNALILVRWIPAASTTDAAVRPALQVLSQWRDADALLQPPDADSNSSDSSDSNTLPCFSPDPDTQGPMQTLGPPFGWVAVGQRWLLGATAARSEGYAGGGGNFTSRVLLEQRGEQLVPVACYSVENYQMFGGDWNPDGTRQHPEALSQWTLQVQPGKAAQGAAAWPDLLLRPRTRHTPAGRMVWNAASGYYVPVTHPAKGD